MRSPSRAVGLLLLLLPLLLAGPLRAESGSKDPAELLRSIESLEIEMLRADEELRGATTRVRDAEGRIAVHTTRLQSYQSSMEERKRRMSLRLQAMYRFRHRGFLPLLFSTSSPHELLRNARYLWWIVRGDDQMLSDWMAAIAQEVAIVRAVQEEKSRLLEAAGESFTRREALETLRDERRSLIKTIQSSNRRKVRKLLLEGRDPKLDVQMDLRQEEAPEEPPVDDVGPYPDFALSKGRLPMPAMGTVQAGDRGIDILAKEGSDIKAVHPGQVSRLMQINGYGLVVIVNHNGGWHTVYTHAQEFKVQQGETVRAGQVLGTVGQTGSLDGPRLHFEVRNGREAEDPVKWLQIPAGIPVVRPG